MHGCHIVGACARTQTHRFAKEVHKDVVYDFKVAAGAVEWAIMWSS